MKAHGRIEHLYRQVRRILGSPLDADDEKAELLRGMLEQAVAQRAELWREFLLSDSTPQFPRWLTARVPVPGALSGVVLTVLKGRWSIKPRAVMGSRMPTISR